MDVSKPISHRRSAVLLCLIVTTFGCSADRADETRTPNSLSIEDARTALVDLVERGDNRTLKMSLSTLNAVEPKVGDDGYLALGPWNVNLTDRRFVVSVIAEPIFEEYEGHFSRTEDGCWSATVDGIIQN